MVRVGDGFLLPTNTGYAFGAVLHVDHYRETAIVRFQYGDYGTASLAVVRDWQGTLARFSAEVKTA